MNFKNTLKYLSTLAVVVAAVFFFYLQFKNNSDAIKSYHFSVSPCYIILSIISGSFALLTAPFVWRIFVNSYLNEKLNFTESYVLYCASAMFKYIPGKIWTYAAQIALMSSKGISKVTLLYINVVSFICLAFVAAVFSLYYYLFCVKVTDMGIAIFIFAALLIVDIAFIVWHGYIINYLIVPINRVFRVEIEPIKTNKMIFVYTQMIYFLAGILLGIAMFFLAKGINMEMPFGNIFGILAAISMSLVLGLIAFFTVGGLGVREGTLFFVLRQFSNIEAALILPVVARFLTIIVEFLMVSIAIIIGIKLGYFNDVIKSRIV